MNTPRTTSVLVAGLATAWLAGCGPAPAPGHHSAKVPSTSKSKVGGKPGATSKPSHRLKVIAFFDQSMGTTTPDPFALAQAHPGLVSYLAPFWYEVSPTGSVVAKPEGNAATLAMHDHLPLIPLFNNAGGTDAFLHTSATRTTAVTNIVNLVKSKKYAGASIDFQLLKATDRSDLTLFMQQLKKAMPPAAMISMSVVPLTSGNGQSSAYDFSALDKVTGSIVLMAYDLHGTGTPPGPVAPYAWVKKSITTAISAGIKPAKLYLGIANYGYLWTNGSTKATTVPIKAMHQHRYGVYTWSPTYQEAYDKYTASGASHVIWFENDKAAAVRISLAKSMHLGGVAFWRIGYEDAQWWHTVATAIGSGATTGASHTKAARSRVSHQHAGRGPIHTVKKAGRKTQRNIKQPVHKTIIAPTNKGKTTAIKTSKT